MILGFKKQFEPKILSGQKKHTIRLDPHNRWKRGNSIQMATGVRTKNYNCFKETECTSVQRVYMSYAYNNIIEISVNGRQLHKFSDKMELALNDGFDTWDEFFDWFHPLIEKTEDNWLEANLIHWTDLRY